MVTQSSFAQNDFQESKPLFSRNFRMMFVVVAVSLAQGALLAADTIWNYIYKKDWILGPSESSVLSGLANTPWIIKPLWAIISDNLPIFGYKRKSYLILTSIIGWLSFYSFGFGPISITAGFVWIFMSNVFLSFQSVVGQAVVVEAAQKSKGEKQKAKSANNGVSLFYGTKLIGKVIYSGAIMLFLTELRRHDFMFFSSFIPVLVLLASFLLPEQRRTNKIHHDLLLENQSTSGNALGNLKKAFEFMKQPIIFKSWLFIFLSNFVPSPAQPKFYYYTTVLEFSPNFLGGLKLIASGGHVIGVIIYNRFCSNMNLKKFYIFTILMVAFVHLSMVLLYFRINLQWGIRDDVFVIFDTFVIDFFQELHSLPILVLACRLCPKNIEATIFAIMITANNLAGNLSSQLGAILLSYLGITSTQFDNLWMFTLINACIQLLPLVLLFTIDFEKAISQASETGKTEETGYEAVAIQQGEGERESTNYSNDSKEVSNTLKL